MSETSLRERVDRAAAILQAKSSERPRAVLILGSGLGPVADAVADPAAVPFDQLPCLPRPTVPGHAGRVLLGRLGGKPVVVFQGRVHLYEGHSRAQVIAPVVLARRLGAELLVATNAAGSVRRDFRPGSFVVLSDHLDLADSDPTGLHEGLLDGPKFTGLTDAHTPALRQAALDAARALGITAHEGVYAMMRGPAYETPAEIRMLRTLGADVVGMSTVPEILAARNLGMDVLAISTVTNLGAGVEGSAPAHEEVAQVAGAVGPAMARWLSRVLEALP